MKRLFALMLAMFSLVSFSQDTVYYTTDANGDTTTYSSIPTGFVVVSVNKVTDEIAALATVGLHTTQSPNFTVFTPNTYSSYTVDMVVTVDSTPQIESYFTIDTNTARFYHDTLRLSNSIGNTLINTSIVLDSSSYVKFGLTPQVLPTPVNSSVEVYVKVYHTTSYVKLQSTIGYNELDVPEISVYPNPTTDVLNVSTVEPLDYSIYALNGQLIMSGKTDGKIYVNDLDNGIFILTLAEQMIRFVKR